MPIERQRMLRLALTGLGLEKSRIEGEIARLKAEMAQCELEAAEIESELNQKASEIKEPQNIEALDPEPASIDPHLETPDIAVQAEAVNPVASHLELPTEPVSPEVLAADPETPAVNPI